MQLIWGIIAESLLSFSFLSLATFGIVLIFKTSSTTNFAQGMLGILGAYVTSYLIDKAGIHELTGEPGRMISSASQLILPIFGGIMTAGIFLEHFVENKPFVHLDIAGTAFGKPRTYYSNGATGIGVRTLYELIK